MSIQSNKSDGPENVPVVHLLPSPIPPGGCATWYASGRTLLAALSPSSNSFTAWVAPKADSTARAWEDDNGIVREDPVARVKETYEPDKAIYMGAWASTEDSLHAVGVSRNRDQWSISLPTLGLVLIISFTRTRLPSSTQLKLFIRFTLHHSCPAYLPLLDHHLRPWSSRSRRSSGWDICGSWRRTTWRLWRRSLGIHKSR